MDKMKLMLGTAQFGVDYGISNSLGKTKSPEVEKLLVMAKSEGFPILDTAASYGDCESVLGQFAPLLKEFSIVTKLPYLNKTLSKVSASFAASLAQLAQSKVFGLLFHDPSDLLSPQGPAYFAEALQLKAAGKVQKIGVSVYTVEQLKEITSQYKIDIVQVPLSILDQRFLKDGFLKSLKAQGIEVHVRSVFLQGLLLMNPKDLNSYFANAKNHLQNFQNAIHSHGYSPQEVCLAFVKNIQEVDRIVVGVNDSAQLSELLLAYDKSVEFNYADYKIEDEKILLPSNWKLI